MWMVYLNNINEEGSSWDPSWDFSLKIKFESSFSVLKIKKISECVLLFGFEYLTITKPKPK